MSKQVVKQRKATIPLKRLGKPQDVANTVLFLVSDEANYVTGEIIDANAGLVMD